MRRSLPTALIWAHASTMAMPLRSDEADAAVGDALGTVDVAVSSTCTVPTGTPRHCAHTCGPPIDGYI